MKMKINKMMIYRLCVSVCLLWACIKFVGAQDAEPAKAPLDVNSEVVASKEIKALLRFVPMPENQLPTAFKDTSENVILDPMGSLDGFFAKIADMQRPVRIVHIGDSHIRGHVLPYVMRQSLEDDFGNEAVESKPVTYKTSGIAQETGRPGIVYHILGVNGATCQSFATIERINEITSLSPDLVILSFGTNEAHGRNYSAAEHRAGMQHLMSAIKKACPDVAFLLTTPPGAYVRSSKGRVANPRTPAVVQTELDYAEREGIAVWNLYEISGGKKSACKNWSGGGFFQKDRIHFTHEGYRVQGLLMHEAFIKAYNGYVAAGID